MYSQDDFKFKVPGCSAGKAEFPRLDKKTNTVQTVLYFDDKKVLFVIARTAIRDFF
ncbi:hypothetical protein [Bartonella sp. AU18XJBT]|uniref:hypothetical protein n=1 Tax=Bartonella sp. AU18XJBT TaxID=3019089 RepID=UPI002360E580|nr:hypothetical protein [Bartonella sp. AU18XJBT]